MVNPKPITKLFHIGIVHYNIINKIIYTHAEREKVHAVAGGERD